MNSWKNKIKPEYTPEINEDNRYDLKYFDKDVTNLAAKESFINDEEREKIISKVKDYNDDFNEISKQHK